MPRAIAVQTSLVILLAACSSAPRPEIPAPAPAAGPAAAPAAAPAVAPAELRSLSGEWDVALGGGGTSSLRLAARGGGYVGVLNPFDRVAALGEAPAGGYQVRSATVEGDRATIIVDLDGDDGRIVASFRGADVLDGVISSRRLTGRITLRRR